MEFFLEPQKSNMFYSLLYWLVCGAALCLMFYRMQVSIFTTRVMTVSEGIIIVLFNVTVIIVGLRFYHFNAVLGAVTFFTLVAYFASYFIAKYRGKKMYSEQISLDITRCIEEIKKNPKDKYAYEKLGDIYREIKDYDKALVFYRRVDELSEDKDAKTMIQRKILSTEKDKEYYGHAFEKLIKTVNEEEKIKGNTGTE